MKVKSVRVREEDYNKLLWHANNQKRTLAAQISYYIAYWEGKEKFILPKSPLNKEL